MATATKSDRQLSSIVGIGSFNPAIFHPIWFEKNNLIAPSECETADISIISNEVSVVKFESFLLKSTTDRFSIESDDIRRFQPLCDLVVGTFTILEHTPVVAFGMNNHQEFVFDSFDSWNNFGHNCAPKNLWNLSLLEPGMRKLTIEGRRENSKSQRIQVTVEPSKKLEDNAVQFSLNEHYEMAQLQADETPTALKFVEILQDSWQGFLNYSDEAISSVFKAAEVDKQ